ncbi:class I SAM-dependent methyltransferase [Luteipulveratus mongoliensis]|uniref:SAM-dependent methlyltransferase n=1 Tax=Luteipulveratus mongoliensis TaxID=571913 RepID=A0A0K1JK97_9MICO|nr:methyltransferase domain-containing protein [Luteipulveratus mongoliensis]AKU17126.1 SAM-dependent methlyltransferase [Luteipulveratus mongoliensis]
MSFEVPADAYGRFMGRYSEPLAVEFARWADIQPGQTAVDVGAGTGALTAVLVDRLGVDAVAAIDPSPPFRTALQERFPALEVREGGAEQLPFADDSFDHAVAQLVVQFMDDPTAGLTEMARVTRPGGWVTTCVWDLGTPRSPLTVIWQAAHDIDPSASDETGRVGVHDGDLVTVSVAAGLADVQQAELSVTVTHPDFEEWWEPYTFGVGPAGAYVASLSAEHRDALRDRCRELLPSGSFPITAVAWSARGRA